MISVARADLAATGAAAVLRPVSAEWEAVTPAGRRLALAAGPEVDAPLRRMGELPIGSAVVTPGGSLPADFMIHVIIRSAEEATTAAVVRRALQNGLRRATELGIDSLALAPLGTGPGGLDPDESAGVMVPVILEHMAASAYPATITVVVESDYERDAFERELRSRSPAAETGMDTRARDP